MASDEHPDPQRRRKSWKSLNKERWTVAFDDDDHGLSQGWHTHPERMTDARPISLPFAYQWPLSGINEPDALHPVLWYHTQFQVPETKETQRVLLHFEAVDYEATVWIEGIQVAHHIGGHVPFQADITQAVSSQRVANLVVRVVDTDSKEQPRGKQVWEGQPVETIWYTPTSGIWQTVWLEVVNEHHLDASTLVIVPDIDRTQVKIDIDLSVKSDHRLYIIEQCISTGGKTVLRGDSSLTHSDDAKHQIAFSNTLSLPTGADWLWSPENPKLFDLRLRLINKSTGLVVDELFSYFGMRKISIENGRVCLNNEPYYQRLVLDQGYWPESGMTPPSDEALRRDIELAKSFGFNGARKHMKPGESRWLYWCDKLGFLAWCECPATQAFTPLACQWFKDELTTIIKRDVSHPCILTWCCINENWGLGDLSDGPPVIGPKQIEYLEELRKLVLDLDPSRLVSVNDGWDNITSTDLVGIHDYTGLEHMEKTWPRIGRIVRDNSPLATRAEKIWAKGQVYRDQPILCTEAFETGDFPGDETDTLSRLKRFADTMQYAQGFVYTQLTDVMQEHNGISTFERRPKVNPSKVRHIFEAIQYVG